MRIEQVKSKEEELSVYYEQLTMGNKMLCLQAINRFWLDPKMRKFTGTLKIYAFK